MADFCAYCFGPLAGKVKTKNDRTYHPECEPKDRVKAEVPTLPGGVRVGGRGADWIEKSNRGFRNA